MLSILNPLYRLNGVVLDNIYKINNGLIIYEFDVIWARIFQSRGRMSCNEMKSDFKCKMIRVK